MSCVYRLPSEGQAALAGAVRQGRDATVVLVAGAVEDHALDTSGLRALGNELADLAGLGSLVALDRADVGLHGRGGRERLADQVVDDLHADVLRGPRHHEARTLRGAVDLLAAADLTPRAGRDASRGVLASLECDSHRHLPAFPTLRRMCSP